MMYREAATTLREVLEYGYTRQLTRDDVLVADHALDVLVAAAGRADKLEEALRHYAGHGYPTTEGAVARAALADYGGAKHDMVDGPLGHPEAS